MGKILSCSPLLSQIRDPEELLLSASVSGSERQRLSLCLLKGEWCRDKSHMTDDCTSLHGQPGDWAASLPGAGTWQEPPGGRHLAGALMISVLAGLVISASWLAF